MNIYSVYKLTIGDKSYIGLSAYPVSRRLHHETMLEQNKHYNKSMQQAFNDHGSYDWMILDSGLPKHKGMKQELYWIAELDTINNGFNTHSSNKFYRGSFLERVEIVSS